MEISWLINQQEQNPWENLEHLSCCFQQAIISSLGTQLGERPNNFGLRACAQVSLDPEDSFLRNRLVFLERHGMEHQMNLVSVHFPFTYQKIPDHWCSGYGRSCQWSESGVGNSEVPGVGEIDFRVIVMDD